MIDEKTILMMDKRIAKFAEGTIIGEVLNIYLKDMDCSFQFANQKEAQDFLNRQSVIRFLSKKMKMKDAYFDYTEVYPTGKEIHRYHIEKLNRGKILSYKEEVIPA